jgi:hypothetical protein
VYLVCNFWTEVARTFKFTGGWVMDLRIKQINTIADRSQHQNCKFGERLGLKLWLPEDEVVTVCSVPFSTIADAKEI